MPGLKSIYPDSKYESPLRLQGAVYVEKYKKILPKNSFAALVKAMQRAIHTNLGPQGSDFLCLGMSLGDRSKVAHEDVQKLWGYTEEVFMGNRSWDDLGTLEADQLLVEMKKALGTLQKWCVAMYATEHDIDVLYYVSETDRIDPMTQKKITITYYLVPKDSSAA